MRIRASRILLSPIDDVWRFLSEPHQLSDWWPGIGGVQPDRRGFAPGARWQVVRGAAPGLFRRPTWNSTLLVTAVEPMRRFAFYFTDEHMLVELTLEPRDNRRTLVDLELQAPLLLGTRRTLARRAVARLHMLLRTGED